MRWLRRRRHDPVTLFEDDRATGQFQDLAAEWQANEPTRELAVEPPLMTLAAQWRAGGGFR